MNQNLDLMVKQAVLRGLARKAEERIKAVGVMFHRVNEGPWAVEECNIVVNEGLNDLLNVCLHNSAQSATWYVALFEGLAAPVATLTAAEFANSMTETTTYDETTHPEWKEDHPGHEQASDQQRCHSGTVYDECHCYCSGWCTDEYS